MDHLDDYTISVSSPEPIQHVSNFLLGTYQQRRRLLSCIAENWSETDLYNSLPMEQIDTNTIDNECMKLFQAATDELTESSLAWMADDASDCITTLDESCVLDIESLEDISETNRESHNSDMNEQLVDRIQRPMSSNASMRPTNDLNATSKNARMLTTSCYGKLENINQNEDNPYRSNDELLQHSTHGISDEFLFLNPIFSRGKCRTPLPVMSMNSSFYDETTSLNGSVHDQNNVQLNELEEKLSQKTSPRSVNPIEDESVDKDAVVNRDATTENGKCTLFIFYYFQFFKHRNEPE